MLLGYGFRSLAISWSIVPRKYVSSWTKSTTNVRMAEQKIHVSHPWGYWEILYQVIIETIFFGNIQELVLSVYANQHIFVSNQAFVRSLFEALKLVWRPFVKKINTVIPTDAGSVRDHGIDTVIQIPQVQNQLNEWSTSEFLINVRKEKLNKTDWEEK